MSKFYCRFIIIVFLSLSGRVIAQPLPCPPINSTFINGYGDTTICAGSCTTIGCTYTTTIKSTSSYNFSTIPYLPTSYTGTNSVLVGIDDTWSNAITLPFPFCFYGSKYTQCWIGANGQISFTPQMALSGGSDPWPIDGPWPSYSGDAVGVKNCIMGAYYDIDPSEGGNISWSVYGTAPCRTFVVSWNNVPLFDAGLCPGQFGTEQVVLYESTYAIDIFIHQKPLCTSWNNGFAILGIADATGANYVFAPGYNGTTWSVTDSGYRFTPSGPPTWNFIWTDNTGAVISTSPVLTVCPTDSTTYHVEGIVSTLCNDSFKVYSSVFVNVGPNPTVSSTSLIEPTRCGLCDGSITLHGLVPGISDTIYYLYNGVLQPYVVETSTIDSTLTLTGLCGGTYDSIVVKVGQCHTDPIGPIFLIPPPLSIGTALIVNPSVCGACDGALTITGLLPGYTYTLNYNFGGVAQGPITITTTSSGTYQLTNLCAGTYDNIVANIDTCVTPAIGPFTLIAPPPYNIFIANSSNPSECGRCDGSMTLRAVPPFSSDTISYSLNGVVQTPIITVANGDSTIFLPGLCAGVYSDMSVKIGPCASPVVGIATLVAPPLHAGFDTSIHMGCHGDTVLFYNASTSTGALYYVWSFGDGTSDTSANPTHIYAQGNYTVTLIATNHFCSDSMKKPISLIHPLSAVFTDSPGIVCQGKPVTFTNSSVGTGITYNWNFGDGDTAISANPVYIYNNTGTYTVQLIVTDYIPCRDTASAIVYVDTISGIKLLTTDTVLCAGTYVTLTGLYSSIGNTEVVWQFGNGDSMKNVNPVMYAYTAAGTYTVSVSAHYRACPDTTASDVINVMPQPIVYLGPDTSICPGSESLVLGDNNVSPLATWLWNTGQTSATITVVAPGYYYATVNVNNCYASDSVWVSNDCYMNIPNVFTPNGDGTNDYFFPRQYLSKGLTSFKMNIYNRWGQLIFESSSLDGRGWDGSWNNTPQPEGVYVYIIDATFKDGQKEHHQGNVTLLR